MPTDDQLFLHEQLRAILQAAYKEWEDEAARTGGPPAFDPYDRMAHVVAVAFNLNPLPNKVFRRFVQSRPYATRRRFRG